MDRAGSAIIALDANVVRLLFEGDAAPLAKALGVLKTYWEQGGKVFHSDIVLAELEWVLGSVYSVPRPEILSTFHAVGTSERFRVQDQPRLLEALQSYQSGRADLADYLIGLAGNTAGADTTLTFDRALRTDRAFHVL